MILDPCAVARALGGQVAGRDTVLVPGPGHSTRDRSLAVRLDPTAPDGFLIYSHAGDDWKTCRDHVRLRLACRRGRRATNNAGPFRSGIWRSGT